MMGFVSGFYVEAKAFELSVAEEGGGDQFFAWLKGDEGFPSCVIG